jgi:hypothetical protein
MSIPACPLLRQEKVGIRSFYVTVGSGENIMNVEGNRCPTTKRQQGVKEKGECQCQIVNRKPDTSSDEWSVRYTQPVMIYYRPASDAGSTLVS